MSIEIVHETYQNEIQRVAALYQAECRRSEEWRIRFENMEDERDGLRNELRKATKRIKLLESEIEELVNEGSPRTPQTD